MRIQVNDTISWTLRCMRLHLLRSHEDSIGFSSITRPSIIVLAHQEYHLQAQSCLRSLYFLSRNGDSAIHTITESTRSSNRAVSCFNAGCASFSRLPYGCFKQERPHTARSLSLECAYCSLIESPSSSPLHIYACILSSSYRLSMYLS